MTSHENGKIRCLNRQSKRREALADAGIRDPAGSDMLFSIISGLISQQTANEPGGDRWIRLCDGAVQMFFDYFDKRQGGRRDDHDG